MDAPKLRELLSAYSTNDPDFQKSNWHVPDDAAIECGTVSRDSLLHTYRRRLKRTRENHTLHTKTENLVAFLRDYPEEELTMVNYYTSEGEMRLFLANYECSRILFWMSMFK
ncbi:hypothetical protein ACLIYP_21165 [Streptomyces nanhaiensis]|uniref:hypothetical protein n=1 Tax=Streptomyces nanhaiensis TaxID=679319 RepID=UPI00399D4D0F